MLFGPMGGVWVSMGIRGGLAKLRRSSCSVFAEFEACAAS